MEKKTERKTERVKIQEYGSVSVYETGECVPVGEYEVTGDDLRVATLFPSEEPLRKYRVERAEMETCLRLGSVRALPGDASEKNVQ